jgi:hypothetical protein
MKLVGKEADESQLFYSFNDEPFAIPVFPDYSPDNMAAPGFWVIENGICGDRRYFIDHPAMKIEKEEVEIFAGIRKSDFHAL